MNTHSSDDASVQQFRTEGRRFGGKTKASMIRSRLATSWRLAARIRFGAFAGMATRKTATATFTRALTATVLAGGLAVGFAGSAAAAPSCPGSPVPYGLIGDTWSRYWVQDRIGCPGEPEHDVPGRRGRLQTFEHGQIAWTPDQGQRMTIWAIRDKAHFHVRWSTNDPMWSYDNYLIRWDRDGRNVGQRDISGTTEGWWDFQFDTPGTYTFIVEGRSGGGYHHGWTIPVGGTVQPGDIAPPAPNVDPKPAGTISVTGSGSGFRISGSGFDKNKGVGVRVADDFLQIQRTETSSDENGRINLPWSPPCKSGSILHFSATDGRPNRGDLTGFLWSNTVTATCP